MQRELNASNKRRGKMQKRRGKADDEHIAGVRRINAEPEDIASAIERRE